MTALNNKKTLLSTKLKDSSAVERNLKLFFAGVGKKTHLYNVNKRKTKIY